MMRRTGKRQKNRIAKDDDSATRFPSRLFCLHSWVFLDRVDVLSNIERSIAVQSTRKDLRVGIDRFGPLASNRPHQRPPTDHQRPPTDRHAILSQSSPKRRQRAKTKTEPTRTKSSVCLFRAFTQPAKMSSSKCLWNSMTSSQNRKKKPRQVGGELTSCSGGGPTTLTLRRSRQRSTSGSSSSSSR